MPASFLSLQQKMDTNNKCLIVNVSVLILMLSQQSLQAHSKKDPPSFLWLFFFWWHDFVKGRFFYFSYYSPLCVFLFFFQCWEYGISLCRELAFQYEALYDYQSLSWIRVSAVSVSMLFAFHYRLAAASTLCAQECIILQR